MAKLLVIGACPGCSDAVSSAFEGVLSRKSKDEHQFTFFNFGEKEIDIQIGPDRLVVRRSPFLKPLSISRIKRKASRLLRIDDSFVLVGPIMRALRTIFPSETFDCIIGVAGQFSFVEATHRFARQRKIPFRFCLFDPYAKSTIGNFNRKVREAREHKWVTNSVAYCLDKDGGPGLSEAARDESKERTFLIPIFFKERESIGPRKRNILYGGRFYKDIRTPEGIVNLSKRQDMQDFQFLIYSNWKGKDTRNLHFMGTVPKSEYAKLLSESAAGIAIGNKGVDSNYRSSKYLELVGYCLPIICIDIDIINDPVLSKYPLAFSSSDPCLGSKLQTSLSSCLSPMDIEEKYPERTVEAFLRNLLS